MREKGWRSRQRMTEKKNLYLLIVSMRTHKIRKEPIKQQIVITLETDSLESPFPPLHLSYAFIHCIHTQSFNNKHPPQRLCVVVSTSVTILSQIRFFKVLIFTARYRGKKEYTIERFKLDNINTPNGSKNIS